MSEEQIPELKGYWTVEDELYRLAAKELTHAELIVFWEIIRAILVKTGTGRICDKGKPLRTVRFSPQMMIRTVSRATFNKTLAKCEKLGYLRVHRQSGKTNEISLSWAWHTRSLSRQVEEQPTRSSSSQDPITQQSPTRSPSSQDGPKTCIPSDHNTLRSKKITTPIDSQGVASGEAAEASPPSKGPGLGIGGVNVNRIQREPARGGEPTGIRNIVPEQVKAVQRAKSLTDEYVEVTGSQREMWAKRLAEMNAFAGGESKAWDLLREVKDRQSPDLRQAKGYNGPVETPGAWLNAQTRSWIQEQETRKGAYP